MRNSTEINTTARLLFSTTMAQLYVKTPLLHSSKLSKINKCNVWLKMENAQPSGSFKIRGISEFAKKVYIYSVRVLCNVEFSSVFRQRMKEDAKNFAVSQVRKKSSL